MGYSLQPTRVDWLPNGMRVLTRELHHAPVASVMVWYGVGSRNEQPGETGLSHFLEHMMFKGTKRFPYGSMEEGVKLRGGMWNAFTSHDYTAYYEVLPARHLEYGLEVEADRMVNMHFDPDLTVRERGIIVSEREGRENSPHFWLYEAFMHEAFQQMPYRHHVLGHKDDIKSTTAEALTRHYRRFYRPRNATLVVAGDFDTPRLLELANRHFGSLDGGEALPPLAATEPEQVGERRVEVRRPAPNPSIMAGYKIPPDDHPDTAALTILSAVLSGGPSFAMMGGGASMGRSSRLYRKLINTGTAASAVGRPWSMQHAGLFLLHGTPVPGVAMEKLEGALYAEVEELRQDRVPADELERAKKQVRAQFVYAMEGAMNQAVLLGATAMVRGVEGFDHAMAEFEAVTADDVLRVAQTYLSPERRTVGWLIPESATAATDSAPAARAQVQAQPAEAEAATTPEFQKPGHAGEPPAPGQRGRILDHTRIVRRELPGGATLLVYPAETIPSVMVRVQMEAGAIHAPEAKAGLAQLTVQLLNRGSRAFSAEELALKTDALGMSMSFDIGRETAVGTLKCLPEDLQTGVDLMAEVIRHPTFPQDEMDRMLERMLVAVREAEDNTRAVASRRLAEIIYPEGYPYRAPVNGTEESLRRLVRDDLAAFHAEHYGPKDAIISVVGNVDPDAVERALNRAFEGWSGGAGRPAMPAAPQPAGGRREHKTVAGKTQTDIALGWPLVDRRHPDYLALEFLATLFGGNGTPASSRLFRDVREKYGLSYYQFASFGSALGSGAWSAHIGVNPARLEFAVDVLRQELQRLVDEPVAESELEGLKAFLEDYPAVQHESPERVAARLAEMERYKLGLDYVDRYPSMVRALTAGQLQDVAARYLSLDRLAVVTAGPEPEAK
ncbi:MAG TPA: pitrilysin family protein [Symbiobacteriaceae bacterium]|nr:pitrilysin family protein [Symbiobacteriaceae bacterium]